MDLRAMCTIREFTQDYLQKFILLRISIDGTLPYKQQAYATNSTL
jgi:hypothetical protein